MIDPSRVARAVFAARRTQESARALPVRSPAALERDRASFAHTLLERRLDRRAALRGLAALAALPVVGGVVGCAVDAAGAGLALENADGSCNTIPEETEGPYPADGSNGPSVFDMDGFVRSDLRTSFGGYSGTAEGVTLTLVLDVVDAACEPLAGHAVYVWHCDADGDYSLYTAADASWLRGVQVTDDDGRVTFTTIFPGCYDGRYPHIHFEVYRSVESALAGDAPVATSQLAFPESACTAVYATEGYAKSQQNFASESLATDGIFSDGSARQVATMSGDVDDALTASLLFAV